MLFSIGVTKGYYGDGAADNQDEEKQVNQAQNVRDLCKNTLSYSRFYWLTFHGIMVIGGIAFLLMLMTNWIALDYAYYGKGTNTKTYATKNAMWV